MYLQLGNRIAIHPHPNQRLWMGDFATFVKNLDPVIR